MTKQTTVRLPPELAEKAEAIARAEGKSLNQLILDALAIEIDRVRSDSDFLNRLKKMVDRDQEILDELAK
jgi:predicted transcriptional regulator